MPRRGQASDLIGAAVGPERERLAVREPVARGVRVTLAVALRDAGVEQDLPCIFHGIAEDARERVTELREADTQAERDAAFMNLRVLLDDAKDDAGRDRCGAR